MHPEIVRFPNEKFYEGKLNTEFKENKDVNIKPFEIIDINSNEEKSGSSYMNLIEAKVVVYLANKLKQTYNDTIIISPYKGQCELLKSLDSKLVIHTVDSFFKEKERDNINNSKKWK